MKTFKGTSILLIGALALELELALNLVCLFTSRGLVEGWSLRAGQEPNFAIFQICNLVIL